jgi:hypothetical protein
MNLNSAIANIKKLDAQQEWSGKDYDIYNDSVEVLLALAQSIVEMEGKLPIKGEIGENFIDRFYEIEKGLKIEHKIANKLANFITYEIMTAKKRVRDDCALAYASIEQERKEKFEKKMEGLEEVLHNAGLDAYQDYVSMGKSADEWNKFRNRIAQAIKVYLTKEE